MERRYKLIKEYPYSTKLELGTVITNTQPITGRKGVWQTMDDSNVLYSYTLEPNKFPEFWEELYPEAIIGAASGNIYIKQEGGMFYESAYGHRLCRKDGLEGTPLWTLKEVQEHQSNLRLKDFTITAMKLNGASYRIESLGQDSCIARYGNGHTIVEVVRDEDGQVMRVGDKGYYSRNKRDVLTIDKFVIGDDNTLFVRYAHSPTLFDDFAAVGKFHILKKHEEPIFSYKDIEDRFKFLMTRVECSTLFKNRFLEHFKARLDGEE